MSYYIDFWKRAFDFRGVASRKEYWIAFLFNIIVVFVIGLVLAFVSDEALNVFQGIYSLLIIIPSISISVRRLHDSNKSGLWYLLSLIPVIGGLIVFIFMLMGTVRLNNRWRMYDIHRGKIREDIFEEPLSETAKWTYKEM